MCPFLYADERLSEKLIDLLRERLISGVLRKNKCYGKKKIEVRFKNI
jgi:hypothetical protein